MSDRFVHFAIKAQIDDFTMSVFEFIGAKTMYSGKRIRPGDRAFLFASENEGGPGLMGSGIVTFSQALPKLIDVPRQTPRITIIVQRETVAKRPLGRAELKRFSDWHDGRPETELNFKLYRQATNKVVGISDVAARFLESFL